MSCEVFNESDFGMIEGTPQTFLVDLYNIAGEIYDNIAIDLMEWRLSKYGETEMLSSVSSENNQITINSNVITIYIDSSTTDGLFGKFTHQLMIKDVRGNQFIADLGKISIKPRIK